MILKDTGVREMTIFVMIIVSLVCLGLYPQPVLNISAPAIKGIMTRHEIKAPTKKPALSEIDPVKKETGN
jgi:NADH:ubiquinone oxidoreductase subunit 4 (subunit M)